MTRRSAGPEVFVADRVWDGVASQAIGRGFVSVQDGKISAVGRAADLPEGTEVTELGDATILPGLINAHVHLTFSASHNVVDDYLVERQAGTETLLARAKENLFASVRGGVTTVRDLGTLNDVVFAARRGVRDGSIVGPDVIAAGEGITSSGGHCWFFGIECTGEDALREAVLRQHEAGADCIKVFATGGNLTPNTDPFAPQFTEAELRAAVEEARSHGLPVAAHAHAPQGIANATAARVDTIEHCLFETLDGVAFDERVAAEMAEHGIAAVPTPGAGALEFAKNPTMFDDLPPERAAIVKRILRKFPIVSANIQRMRELGVDVIAGTDAGIPQRRFEDFPDDLRVFADDNAFGMGARTALMAATSRCAASLGLDDRGILSAGRRADVLVVDGDPLADIHDLQRTKLVLVAGVRAV